MDKENKDVSNSFDNEHKNSEDLIDSTDSTDLTDSEESDYFEETEYFDDDFICIEIMFSDFTPEAQKKIAYEFGFESVEDLISKTNWDKFSCTSICIKSN